VLQHVICGGTNKENDCGGLVYEFMVGFAKREVLW